LICSRCGHQNIPSQSVQCPNCQFEIKSTGRTPTSTGTFRALSARRKMLTQRNYSLPFSLGDEAFGRFKVRDLLGQGPMAVVYQVTDERGNLWALKLLNKRWRDALDFDTFQGTFLKLDEIDKSLVNIPSEILSNEDHVALLNPLVEGLTFRKVMTLRKNTAKAFTLDEVQSVFQAIYKALLPLHEQNIAHGGLKPENFFVSADQGSTKQKITLSDVCLGEAIGFKSFSKAQRTSGLGHCIAPEVMNNYCDLRSDIFSLGTFIFEALTGQMTQGKRSIEELIPFDGITPLSKFLDQCMHVDPQQRFADIQEMHDAFTKVCISIKNIKGSPFASESTQPKIESQVTTRKDLLDALITAAPLGASDPLISVITPPPLPVHLTQPNDNRLSGLPSHVSPPHISSLHSMGNHDALDAENTLPTAYPIFNQGQNTPPPTLDTLSTLRASPDLVIEPIQEVEPFHKALDLDIGALSIPSQPTGIPKAPVLTSQGSWFLSSKLGFAMSTLSVIALTVFFVLHILDDQKNKPYNSQLTSQANSVEMNSVLKIGSNGVQVKTKEKRNTEKAISEKIAAEKVALEKATAEKIAAERAAAKKIAAEKVTAEKVAAERAATERIAIEKATTAREAATKATAAKATAAKATAAKATAAKATAAKATAAKATAAKPVIKKERINKKEKESKASPSKAQKSVTPAVNTKVKTQRSVKTQAKKEPKSKNDKKPNYREYQEDNSKKSSAALPSKGEVKQSGNTIFCPKGMIVKTMAHFPRNSIKRGKIKGKRAVALAKNGKAFCIDAFEYPGRGRKPKVNVTFAGAQALCSQVNKRLCTDREWIRSCKGKRGSIFPYSGSKFNAKRCNTEDANGEERGVSPAGRFKLCRSPGGVYDMSGNVAEWTASKTVRGGYYASADEDAACNGGGRRAPGSKRLYIGFRCCADFR
jgi:serine/threonine protein kinase